MSGRPIVKISGFKREVPVMNSKQRPRRLIVAGDNGQQFGFLLKGTPKTTMP
jgi:FKBP12-rapamycin complex-associated protein